MGYSPSSFNRSASIETNKNRHLNQVVKTEMDHADITFDWLIFINSNVCMWGVFTY